MLTAIAKYGQDDLYVRVMTAAVTETREARALRLARGALAKHKPTAALAALNKYADDPEIETADEEEAP